MQADVVIVGGGPAGAAAGRLLAAWGHAVLLFAKRGSAAETLAESIPPSCRKLFQAIGVLDAVDAAGFYRSTGNTIWWGPGESRSECFADGELGYQVRRRELDQLLVAQAEAAGVRVVHSPVRRVELEPPATDDPRARVYVAGESDGERAAPVAARVVLDCSGRAGVIARQGLRHHGGSPATLAVAGVWRRSAGWPLDEPSHTLVEAYRDGWAWSVPIEPSRRYVTVMVDPRVTELDRGGDLAATYRREVDKTAQLSRLTDAAELEGPPWACDASVYSAKRYIGAAFALVGDAASFIDPLSSFGVKKALASAWMAAIVTNTCLVRPEMTEAAHDFYAGREAEVFSSYARQTAEYFRDAAAAHDHPFWTGRSSVEDDLMLNQPVSVDVAALRQDTAVQAAFAAVKRSQVIALVPGDRLRVEHRPGVSGREVVLEDWLVLETHGLGRLVARFVRGVDLPALVRMAGGCRHVPDLFEAYNLRHPPVILPDFLGTLSLLLAAGALKNTVNSAETRRSD